MSKRHVFLIKVCFWVFQTTKQAFYISTIMSECLLRFILAFCGTVRCGRECVSFMADTNISVATIHRLLLSIFWLYIAGRVCHVLRSWMSAGHWLPSHSELLVSGLNHLSCFSRVSNFFTILNLYLLSIWTVKSDVFQIRIQIKLLASTLGKSLRVFKTI